MLIGLNILMIILLMSLGINLPYDASHKRTSSHMGLKCLFITKVGQNSTIKALLWYFRSQQMRSASYTLINHACYMLKIGNN